MRGQVTSGKKVDLLLRLKLVLDAKLPVLNILKDGRTKKKDISNENNSLRKFSATAFWRVLHPNSQPIKEPTNDTFQNPRAPTISEKDSELSLIHI